MWWLAGGLAARPMCLHMGAHHLFSRGKLTKLTGTMMDPLVLLPDFPMILEGFCLCRHKAFGCPTRGVVERQVHHLLLPASLTASIVRGPRQLGLAAALLLDRSPDLAHASGLGPRITAPLNRPG